LSNSHAIGVQIVVNPPKAKCHVQHAHLPFGFLRMLLVPLGPFSYTPCGHR